MKPPPFSPDPPPDWPADKPWPPRRWRFGSRAFFRHRPPWWPEDEPWPPTEPPRMYAWRRMRGHFLWRILGFVSLLFFFTVGGCTLAFWLTAVGLGRTHLSGNPTHLYRIAGYFIVFFAIITLGLIGRALLRNIAWPVGDLLDAAGRVTQGDYAARVDERGPREVRALARAFNGMAARLQLEAEQRRNLLADVTHELRTPLTVLQGNLEALLDGMYPRDDAHLLPILEETRVLASLVDDLRTLALAESGALQLQRELTDLGVLIGETLASFQTQADAAGVTLALALEEGLPLVEVDPTRLRQVLINLIANALRYTPRGGEIKVSGGVNQTAQQVILEVHDTGVGITPAALPRLFDRFYKSPDSPGSGLGLAIAKNLIEAHGGEISIQSEPGPGTTFRLVLPLT